MKNRKKRSKQEFAFLFKKQAGKCAWCHESLHPRDIECDHIIPLCCQGEDVLENLQLLCGSCHNIKTKQDLIQYNIVKQNPIEETSPYFTLFAATVPQEMGYYPFCAGRRQRI